MEFSIDEIRFLALRDVRLAYAVLLGRPGIWNAKITFPGGVTGDRLSQTILASTFGCDVFVRDLEYTIRRPKYLLGNAFKAENDTNTTLSPFVDIEVLVEGCPKWEYTDGDTPLEIAATAATKAHDRSLNWYLPYLSSVRVNYMLKRDLLPLENPFEIDLTFKGKYLDMRNFGNLTEVFCFSELRKFGILPPAGA